MSAKGILPLLLSVVCTLALGVQVQEVGPPEERGFRVPVESRTLEFKSLRNIDIVEEEDERMEKSWWVWLRQVLFGMTEEEREIDELYQSLVEGQTRTRNGILQTSYDTVNQNDDIFVITAYIGSNQQVSELVVDTGSQWTTVMTDECSNCDEASYLFDPTLSTSYIVVDESNTVRIDYNKWAQVQGVDSFDAFYMDIAQTFGSPSFEFLSIKKQRGVVPNCGIMGLGLDYQLDTEQAGKLYYYELVDEGEIGAYKFATLFNDVTGSSFVDFGTHSTGEMSDLTVRYLDVEQEYYWQMPIYGVMFGTSSSTNQYALETSETILFDTGTSFGYLPWSNGKKAMKQLLSGVKSFRFFGHYYSSCDETEHQSMWLMLGSYWFEINPSTLLDQMYDKTSGKYSCRIRLQLHKDEVWYMGNVFLRGFYTVWDAANEKVWFAPKTGGSAEVIDATLPSDILA